MSSVSKPRVRHNRHKQGLNLTLEKLSADFRYNSIGALVYKGYDKTIALDGNGVYILTVEGRTFKFAM